MYTYMAGRSREHPIMELINEIDCFRGTRARERENAYVTSVIPLIRAQVIRAVIPAPALSGMVPLAGSK